MTPVEHSKLEGTLDHWTSSPSGPGKVDQDDLRWRVLRKVLPPTGGFGRKGLESRTWKPQKQRDDTGGPVKIVTSWLLRNEVLVVFIIGLSNVSYNVLTNWLLRGKSGIFFKTLYHINRYNPYYLILYGQYVKCGIWRKDSSGSLFWGERGVQNSETQTFRIVVRVIRRSPNTIQKLSTTPLFHYAITPLPVYPITILQVTKSVVPEIPDPFGK